MLTAREFQLTNKLLNTKSPLRIKDLSVEFGVSTRTIKYDLENVREWFKEQGKIVNSQTTKGIWVECGDSERLELRGTLTKFERSKIYPDQTVRVKRIILSLLLSNDYRTANELSDVFEVSRNTILSDMHQVENFLKSWTIDLERKQRTGFRLIGNELQLRLMLEHIIYNDLDDYEIYKLTTRITKREQDAEIGSMFDDQLKAVYETVEKHMIELYTPSLAKLIRLSDLLKLLLRITFSVTRLNMGHTINSYRILDPSHYEDDTSLFLLSVMEQVYTDMKLPLLEEEYLYISGGLEKETDQMDLVDITERIIHYVSLQEGIDYKRDPKLYSNLLSHLSLRLQNGYLYLN